MNQNKFFKVFSYVAFASFMFISCWATVESLHLLLPTWPIPLFWVATIGIFILASIGSKLIVDSFNQSVQVENRGWRLIGGIVMLLFFWVLFILPTNTHTFFYRSEIKEVLIKDLQSTKDKLQELIDEGIAGKIIEQEKADFRRKVDEKFGLFDAEINHPDRPGWAERAEAFLVELEGMFGGEKILRPNLVSNTIQGRRNLVNAIKSQVEQRVESYCKSVYDSRLERINKGLNKGEMQELVLDIQKVQNFMKANPSNNDEPTEKTSLVLSQSYKIIDNYSDILIEAFKTEYPEMVNVAQKDKEVFYGKSQTEKMRNVIDVWKNFFKGNYAGRGFIYWILIAALIDIAGFIFFDIALKKDEY